MVYYFHFNFFMLVWGLLLMATGGCSKRSLIIERVMLIGFLLCAGVIPFCPCIGSEDGSKVGGSCIQRERRALLAIRADIYDPDQWLSSWTGQDCCQWRGVSCDNTTSGHVVKLDLRYPYAYDLFDGTKDFPRPSKVNPSIASLKYLRYLDLSMNNFSRAPIPEFIGSLMHLEYLNLSQAWFSGAIPHQIGNLSKLHSLDLGGCFFYIYNEMEGYFESRIAPRVHDLHWLSRITSLQYLDLSLADLSKASNWLHEINMHPSLLVLKLSDTGLPGIPSTLQHVNFTSLTMLDLSSNDFQTAIIPRWLLNISSLVRLDLGGCNFTGRLSLLENLAHLRILQLPYNQISGEIPKNLGNLSHLESLDLWYNKIWGEIPKSIGNLAHLQHLGLSFNNITGQIPENISMLCNLQELNLSGNRIGGEITSLIEGFSKCIKNTVDGRSFLQSLTSLLLGNNNFSGTIPESLGQLSGLEYLYLSYNNFSGTIPESLGQLSRLVYLDLSPNSFTGYLTEVHFSNLTRLKTLNLSYNSLKMITSDSWIPSFNASSIYMCSCHVGPKFPAWLRTQIYLEVLCLSEAGISGKIPSWLWYNHIHYLNVSHNSMDGQLPGSLGSHVYSLLDLSYNCFSGPIPNVNVDYMILSNNFFSGPIPLSFSENVYLTVLSLSHNHINGSIPQFLCNWTSLEVLDLSDNRLTGGFPDCWSKSQPGIHGVPKKKRIEDTGSIVAYPVELQSLHMRNNSLSGKFPSFLRLCKQLVILDLGENKFTGSIPTWIGKSLSSLRVLRLRLNSFDGNIPMQISSLSSLQVLDLAHNNFSGNLPSFFGNFTAMAELQEGSKPMLSDDTTMSYYEESLLIIAKGLEFEYTSVLQLVTSIDLSCNNLFGEVPNEVTNLHGLYFLNLSGNHFVGKIPQNIGNMRQLESLDLSMNDLSGQIPQTMLALNYLSSLNLSYNNLSGRIPSGNQFLTFNDPSIYIGNHNLCGQPLPDCPTNAPPHQEEEEVDEDDREKIWIYASSALGFVMGFWGFVGMVLVKKDIRIAYLRFLDKICDGVYAELAIKFATLKFIMGKS